MRYKITKRALVALTFSALIAFIGTGRNFASRLGDIDQIKQKMAKIGFRVGNIEKINGESYSIHVKSFTPKSQAISLKKSFRPFVIRATFKEGSVSLSKKDLENAGFIVDEASLPGGINVVETRFPPVSLQKQSGEDQDIRRIDEALSRIKRNRREVLNRRNAITQKVNDGHSAMGFDRAMTPASVPPIPIPYPNIPKAIDTSKGSKSVKVDQAETILQKSEFAKSEADELGSRVDRLVRNIKDRRARGDLSDQEKARLDKELMTYLGQAKSLARDLDQYVEDTERLLREAKKEAGMK